MPTYKHKIFLSYASEDLALAEKLEQELNACNISVYRDKTGLRAGTEWERQIESSIEASQHLVVLWSKAAKERSTWVQHEISTFMAYSRDSKVSRHIFTIYLDVMNDVLKPIQGYEQLLVENLYPAQMESDRAKALWKEIVDDLSDRANGAAFTIPVVTVALTEGIINSSNPVLTPPTRIPLVDFLGHHGVPTVEALSSLYGEKPWDWKPFGGRGQTIQTILDDALNNRLSGINTRLAETKGRTVRWKWVDVMNSDEVNIIADVKRVTTRPLILLIDPLSLCNIGVATRYAQFGPWLNSPQTIVAIVPPFEMSDARRYLQQWIRLKAAPFLDGYFDPPPPNERYPEHILSANDDADLSRLVRTALYRNPEVVLPAEQRKRNAITRGGRF